MKNKGITLFLTQLPVGWVGGLLMERSDRSKPPTPQTTEVSTFPLCGYSMINKNNNELINY